MNQQTFSDIEYSNRRKKTKPDEFLEIMNEIIPWEERAAHIILAS
jgi:IS5 family transposase